MITFSGALAEVGEETTRADNTSPLSELDTKFTLYGYKTRDGNAELVFDKYTIEWKKSTQGTSETNTYDWEYGHIPGQSIKFWDFSAENYKFWAATKIDEVNYLFTDRTHLLIKDLHLTLTEPDYLPLYSRINIRKPTIHTVTMEFARVYAKMRVMFFTSQKLKEGDEIEIKDIQFAPVTGGITTSEDVVIDYSAGTNPAVGINDPCQEKFTVGTVNSTCDKLTYDPVILTSQAGIASNNAVVANPQNGDTFVYLPPLNPSTDPVAYRMSLSVDGDDRTAEVPANFMKWQPNFCYTYFFKILEGGVIFVDAKIEPWQKGDSATDTWPNW